MNTYTQWSDAAKDKAIVRLSDARTATLLYIYKWRGTCKVRVDGRHLFVLARQVKMIRHAQGWTPIEPWPHAAWAGPSSAEPEPASMEPLSVEQQQWPASMYQPQRQVVLLEEVTLHPSMLPLLEPRLGLPDDVATRAYRSTPPGPAV